MRVLPALLLAFVLSSASSLANAATSYELAPSSSREIGCMGPCACPVLIQSPVGGTFRLELLGYDGLFTNYAVTDVHWDVPTGSTSEVVTGSGIYRVGGEVARQQQLALDLSIAGREPQHFDSGIVPESEFPKIDVTIYAHRFACWDTAFSIEAVPKTLGVGDEPPPLALGPAFPNPSRTSANLELTLARAGDVTVTVHDARGRVVATLAQDEWLDAGPHTLVWDGRSSGGGAVPAGLYFVRAAVPGTADVLARSIVRLAAR